MGLAEFFGLLNVLQGNLAINIGVELREIKQDIKILLTSIAEVFNADFFCLFDEFDAECEEVGVQAAEFEVVESCQ